MLYNEITINTEKCEIIGEEIEIYLNFLKCVVSNYEEDKKNLEILDQCLINYPSNLINYILNILNS